MCICLSVKWKSINKIHTFCTERFIVCQILIIESNIVYKYLENKATIIILNLQKGSEISKEQPPITHRLEEYPFQDGCSNKCCTKQA